MWKYVSRRIRDSVERTCNVLETRRTWTCNGAEKNTAPPTGAADDQAPDSGCGVSAAVNGCRYGATTRSALRSLVPYQQHSGGSSGSSSSSSSSDDDFRRRGHCHDHEPNVLGALSWSGAIVAGWYTSQLLCMRHRRRHLLQQQQEVNRAHLPIGGWPASVGGSVYARPIHSGVLSQWVRSAPVGQKQPRSATIDVTSNNDGEWLYRLLEISEAPKYRDSGAQVESRVYRVQSGSSGGRAAAAVSDGADEVDCHRTSTTLVSSPVPHQVNNDLINDVPTAPPTAIDGAVQDLLKVIGDIEFQLGVQHMTGERFVHAATHFKLGTSHRHAGSTFNLGLCYELGLGVERSASKALECYSRAAAMGHPKAMYNVGVFHGQGRGGLSKNRRVAREFFVAAARLGQVDARRALGLAVPAERDGDRVNPTAGGDDGWKKPSMVYVPQSDMFQAVAVA